MKHKLALLFVALLCAGVLVPTTTRGVGIVVEIGDHGYYTHGPWYWHHGVRWYWVPGHWAWRHHHRVWIHGYYSPHRYYRYW